MPWACGKSAPTGTTTACSTLVVTIRTPTRKPSPIASQACGGVVMSISTLTRCSSMPNADTFVKAAGSTRRTRPSTAGPPQRSITTGRPGWACTASVVSSSLSTSMRCGSPTSSRAAPAGTVASLAWTTRSTTPLTGAVTASGRPGLWPGLAGCSIAAAWACSCTATSRSAFAISSSRRAPASASRVVSSREGATKPSPASFSVRSCSSLASCSEILARATRAEARSTPAAAALSRAAASRALRSSTMEDMTGLSTATVSPAETRSPSRSAMRASRAATGADTV